ncbi:MAG: glycosyltransferase family 4 protein [Oscillospiraceae bacterium]|nr:glycosyltransferase family 4 protein [Oscillospiraceae bacterium]
MANKTMDNESKKRVAIIIQRYGIEVNGGSEQLARMYAERLKECYDVEIITSCARDYYSWENYYPEGQSNVNGVKVNRFKVDKIRDMKKFGEIAIDPNDPLTEQVWIDEQGPYCPKAIEYIKAEKNNFDVFIFVTYLYYLTVCGIKEVKEKAILIPTAHDEPFVYFNIYKEIFTCPRAIIFSTKEEQNFIHNLFNNQTIMSGIVGVGVDIPEASDISGFKEKHSLDKYILYTGRIDHGKNTPELLDYFIEYKKRNNSKLKLVLMGEIYIEIPAHPDILSLGFVSDEDRINGMAGATVFILPSIYESLSMVVLESMAVGVPVIVNGKCNVLKAHCLESNAGVYYNDYHEFEECINYLMTNSDIYDGMKENAKKYIKEKYQWDVIIEKLKQLINYSVSQP